MVVASFLSFYASFSAKIGCIWLSVWAIRRKAEVDYPLDGLSRLVRWSAVTAGFDVGYYLPGPRLEYARVAGALLGLSFLCWPNFAHHLTNLFRGRTPQDGL
jgi:hypothetical protein